MVSGRGMLIIDAANVVGSVPDGWWRDRAGATRRLRDQLASVDAHALVPEATHVEVVMVVEGAARGVEGSAHVDIVDAPGSGDDAIVAMVAAQPAYTNVVVTADRELRQRVTKLGGRVVGPRGVRGSQ